MSSTSGAQPRDGLFEPFAPGFGIEWLEGTFIPQSIVFYGQLIPIVYECVISLGVKPVRICDVGAASGAGGALVQRVLTNTCGWPADVTAYDIDPRYAPYAAAKFPWIRFLTQDITRQSEKYDIAILSHTLEHIENPNLFFSKLLAVADVIVTFVPYKEMILIPAHVNRFDDNAIKSLPGFVWGMVFDSAVWRTEATSAVAAWVAASEAGMKRMDLIFLRKQLNKAFSSFQIDDFHGTTRRSLLSVLRKIPQLRNTRS